MNKNIFSFLLFFIIAFLSLNIIFWENEVSGAPPYGLTEKEIPALTPWQALKNNWERPDVPVKVGLQIGHLDNHKVPEELKNLKNTGGATALGYQEADINKVIVQKTAQNLREKGIEVDILPTTIPPDYWADVFISIHADGSNSIYTSGYKIAAPWRDLTNKADKLVKILDENYYKKTQMIKDPNITRNMRGYYAFAWWKYNHSIHPMTTAAIVETGFLTNWSDREIIVKNPQIPAQALAEGIIQYLNSENLIQT